jgi:SAM-dependent methyltransferase
MPAKDFGPIESDYAFFMAHATEAECDATQFALELAPLVGRGQRVRLLDFGCGTGEFTERLLTKLNWPADSLELALVEPVTTQVSAAAERLKRFSAHPIRTGTRLDNLSVGTFDVVLTNHVLYYVEDLDQTLRELLSRVVPEGKILAAMAPWDNALMRFWQFGFSLLGEPIPYYAANDLAENLTRLGAEYRKHRVSYELRFPDTRENRLRILRFMFAEHLARIPHDALLTEFDRHASHGSVELTTYSEHFIVAR